jgi:putative transposase
MMSLAASYHGYRFPPEIISHAVWLYHRFCLSFRDTEDLLAQRGITVSYETIRHWCQTFGPDYARRLRRRRGRMGALVHESELARNDPTPQTFHLPAAYDAGLPSPVI